MIRKELTIINKLGMHARAAAKFVQLASGFESDIQLSREDKEVNGKSIMGVMMLAVGRGKQFDLIADGSDEVQAIRELEQLVLNRFGEDE